MKEQLSHTFAPVYDADSRILILGTFPSVKSRENGFYYGHPQNRFWRVLAALAKETLPQTVDEKTAFLLRHGIALWDVVKSCTIEGSGDASIRDVVANDFTALLQEAPIQAIYTNGAKAHELYLRYAYPKTGRMATRLPSTSPANAAYSLARLCGEWKVIFAL